MPVSKGQRLANNNVAVIATNVVETCFTCKHRKHWDNGSLYAPSMADLCKKAPAKFLGPSSFNPAEDKYDDGKGGTQYFKLLKCEVVNPRRDCLMYEPTLITRIKNWFKSF